MIHHGDGPKINQNQLPLSVFVNLVEAKFLTATSVVSSIKFFYGKQDPYEIEGFSVPAPLFLEFLGQKPDIIFEDNQETLQFLNRKGNKNSKIGITEEFWDERRGKKPGTLNIIFYCQAGVNLSYRSARATYKDLYELFKFLQNKNK